MDPQTGLLMISERVPLENDEQPFKTATAFLPDAPAVGAIHDAAHKFHIRLVPGWP